MAYTDNPREAAVEMALSLRWRAYRWAGDDPWGLDCSGMIILILQCTGVLPAGDWTAEDLRQMWSENRIDRAQPGCLLFRFSGSGRAVHVVMAVSERYYVGAEGGGSAVTDDDEARRRNAFIRVGLIRLADWDLIVDPFV